MAEKTCRSAVFPLAAFTASRLLVTWGRQTSKGYSPRAVCKHLYKHVVQMQAKDGSLLYIVLMLCRDVLCMITKV